jgi:hypothetical protein
MKDKIEWWDNFDKNHYIAVLIAKANKKSKYN